MSPGYPSGIAGGMLAVIHVVAKPETTTIDAVVADWVTGPNGQGGTGALGPDVGQTRSAVFFRVLTGTEAGTVTINTTGGDSCVGRMYTYTKDKSAVWEFSSGTTGSDATHGTGWSVTGGADLGLMPGDMVLAYSSKDTDSTGTPSAQAITAAGVTFAATTTRQVSGTTVGNDSGYMTLDALVTDGQSAAAPVYSETDSISECGCTVFVRLRATTGLAVLGTQNQPGKGPSSRARFRQSPLSTEIPAAPAAPPDMAPRFESMYSSFF